MFSYPADREELRARHLTTEWVANWYSDRIPMNFSPSGSPTMAADFCDRLPHLLLLGTEAGEVSLVDCTLVAADAAHQQTVHAGGASGPSRLLHSYPDPVFDLTWGDHLYALAVADNHIYIHDGDTGRTTHCLGFHDSNVRTVRFRPGQQQGILASGGRDGAVALWDLRTADTNSSKNKPSMVISDAHGPRQGPSSASSFSRALSTTRSRHSSTSSPSSVTSFEFLPITDHVMASIGQPDYSVRFWDIRYSWGRGGRAIPYAEIPAPVSGRRQRAFLSLCLNRQGSLLYAVSSDNNVYSFLTSNCHPTPLDIFNAPGFRTSGSFYIRSCLSPDDAYLLCGSTEGHAFIWTTSSKRQAAIRLAEHRFEVSCVAWSSTNEHVFVGGEDYVSRIWRRSPSFNVDKDSPQLVHANQLRLSPIPSVKSRMLRTVKTPHSTRLANSSSINMFHWPPKTSHQLFPVTDRLPLHPLPGANVVAATSSAPGTPSKRPRQLLLDSFFPASPPSSPGRSRLDYRLHEDDSNVNE